MRNLRVWVVALALGALGATADPPRAEVNDRGLGTLHIGSTLDEARAASARKLEPTEPGSPACTVVEPAAPGPMFRVLVANGQVARIDVESPWIATTAGVGVASSLADLKTAYPDAQVELHEHVKGHQVTVALESGLQLVFELEDHGEGVALVYRYRIGRLPEVKWKEGCS